MARSLCGKSVIMDRAIGAEATNGLKTKRAALSSRFAPGVRMFVRYLRGSKDLVPDSPV